MYEYAEPDRGNGAGLREQDDESRTRLNFDIHSYQFGDLDLKLAVDHLQRRDQNILTLHLMGHTQHDIGKICDVSRSMISKRMRVIMASLARQLK